MQIGKSHITLWHKPGVSEIKTLKQLLGINLIVTLLYDKEGPEVILKECEKQEVRNIRIPLKGASDNTLKADETVELVTQSLKSLFEVLNTEELKVLIHCSAGIHRTGTMAYCLLRMTGLDR